MRARRGLVQRSLRGRDDARRRRVDLRLQRRGGGGCLVPVPRDAAAKLGLKGMPKIQSVIAGQPYRGSLMPMGDGTYCLGVLKSIQEAAGVGFGDTVTVQLD